MGITTYNPNNLEVTNKWEYADFINIQPTNRNQVGSLEFSITIRKDRKVETMKFSSDQRSHLLTEALKYRHQFSEKPKEIWVNMSLVIFFVSLIYYILSKLVQI